ncbi:MAG: hypothetical protein AB1629_05720 [Candidatus Omnitrophota bacterium]
MRKIALIIILLVLSTSFGFSQDQPLTLTIKSDKQGYRVGEEIILTAALKNVSEKEMIVFWGNKKPEIFTEEGGVYNVAMYVESSDETLYIKPRQNIEKTIAITLDNKMKPIKGKLGLILLYNSQNLILNYKHRPDQMIFSGVLISNTIQIEVKGEDVMSKEEAIRIAEEYAKKEMNWIVDRGIWVPNVDDSGENWIVYFDNSLVAPGFVIDLKKKKVIEYIPGL